ncbi:MAG TPA: four helix bundle protein [Patescibacteria group bacterium]|nr:four helix bundle protein [Patescibacteria group bacterium]
MQELSIINSSYALYKSVVDITNHLEKRWRYSLGMSLENSVLSLLQELIMAKNAPKSFKSSYLIKAQSHLEIAILKLRLFLEMRIANETKIFQAQSKLLEIGRMLGGWLKSSYSA